MKYVLQIKEGKLEDMNLTEVQEKVLWAIVDIAEKDHDYTVYIVNQEITDQLKLRSRATVGKVINKLVDNGLLIRKGASCYKFNTDYSEFKEVAEAEAFRSVSEWLQDTAFTEENYCVSYRVLKDKSVFSEKDKLAAKGFLIDKVNKYGVAPVVDKINRGLNKTNIVELIYLIM